jgi:periplasmic protein TonB
MLNKRTKRHLFAAGAMVAGSTVVFGSLYYMNEHSTLAPPVEKSEAVAFEIKPPEPQQKPRRALERKRQPNKTLSPKAAPAPSLGSALPGLSFNLPRFEAADLGNVAGDLLGSNAAKSMVMSEEAVDKKPIARKQAAPPFPDKARQRGIEGYVKLNLFITTDGTVEKVRVLEAEPQGIFEESALVAAQTWEFEPAEYNGAPVTGWFKKTVSFKLN